MRPCLALVGAVLLALASGCAKRDPVAERLARRQAYDVELTGWNWKGSAASGEALLNLLVTCGSREPLSRLTVLVEVFGEEDDTPLGSRRLSLEVGGLDYEQPRAIVAVLDGVDPRAEQGGFAVSVEPFPPRGDWPEIPELEDLARTP